MAGDKRPRGGAEETKTSKKIKLEQGCEFVQAGSSDFKISCLKIMRDLFRHRPLHLFDHSTHHDARISSVLKKISAAVSAFDGDCDVIWAGLLLTFDEQLVHLSKYQIGGDAQLVNNFADESFSEKVADLMMGSGCCDVKYFAFKWNCLRLNWMRDEKVGLFLLVS